MNPNHRRKSIHRDGTIDYCKALRDALKTLPNIQDGTFCEDNYQLKAVHYLCEKFRLRCVTGF